MSTAVPQTVQEWYKLGVDLRTQQQGQQQRPSYATLDALLSRVAAERPDDCALRASLLTMIEENALVFLDEPDRAERALAALVASVRSSPDPSSPASAVLKAQAIEACASIMVEVDVVRTQTHTFEQFVSILIELAAACKTTTSSDRVVRSAACQCLRELEETYPGLLCGELPRLLAWLRSERTSAAQEYAALFMCVLRHAVVQALESGRSITVEANEPTVSKMFSVPSTVSYSPSQYSDLEGEAVRSARSKTFETTAVEMLRVVGSLLGNVADFSDWGILAMVTMLEPFARSGMLPPSALQPHLLKLVGCNSPLMLAVLSHLSITFQDVWAPEVEEILNRLVHISGDFQLPLHWRVLAINWLSAMSSRNVRLRPREPLIKDRQRDISPTAFDPLDLKEAKLRCMTHCFDNAKCLPPDGLLDVMICLDDFRAFQDTDKPSIVVFGVLSMWIRSFPKLHNKLFNYIIDVAKEKPHFLPSVLGLVDSIPPSIATSLLEALSVSLVSKVKPEALPPFLSLIKRVLADPQVEPIAMILCVRELVRTTNLCTIADWEIGNSILQICREALLHHTVSALFKPLGDVLSLLSTEYGDLDIRDRATFYFNLLTHVPGKRIQTILTAVSDQSELTVSLLAPNSQPRKERTIIVNSLLEIRRAPPSIFVVRDTDYAHAPADSQPNAATDNALFDEHEILLEYKQFSLSQPPLRVHVPAILQFLPKQPVSRWSAMMTPNQQEPPRVEAPDRLYAPVVEFSDSPLYEPVTAVQAPYLCRGSSAEFPNVLAFELEFTPRVPLPTLFPSIAAFNDAQGRTLNSPVEAVAVWFEDLLLPLPVPESAMRSPAASSALFDALWHRIVSQEDQPLLLEERIGASAKLAGDSGGGEFVKHLQISTAQFDHVARTRLAPFIVRGPRGSTETRVAFALPPAYHMLVRFSPAERDSVTARVSTDFWRASLFLDAFFAKLVEE